MADDGHAAARVGRCGDVADGFDRWASSDRGREQMRGFLEYVEQNGPLVGDFLLSAADAMTQIVEAGAPLGGPTLRILTRLLDVTAALAPLIRLSYGRMLWMALPYTVTMTLAGLLSILYLL